MLRQRRPGRATGAGAAALAVALATFAIYLLRSVAPVVSLSVVYLPAVLLISTYWGLAFGLFTSLLSAAAFNYFHLPPTGGFTIVNGRDWVALAAFTSVAVVASTIAEVARARASEAEARRAEADLAAALSHELLLGADTKAALAGAARRVADALGLAHATIASGTVAAEPGGRALALHGTDGRQFATLVVPGGLVPQAEQQLQARIVPTLSALVAIAQRRDALNSELVETAALRRSDELKTALLRAVSHDLRTPLTAVVAAGHALGADSLTDQERAELSAAVVDEGTRLAGLVDNLLALSRLQAGSARPRSEWVSVEDLISAAAEGLRERPLHVRIKIDPDVPEVRADAAQLERAFANLLENAGRYGGGSPVDVRARRADGKVLVTVADHGPGIDAAERARIFEPFYRGRDAASRAWTGSGLGLAIVKGFVEANGGSISVSSQPGSGTSFEVSLPIAERGTRLPTGAQW
ncbi:MAG: sensor histidine kinase [Solirubrobacteraceae bacterium]